VGISEILRELGLGRPGLGLGGLTEGGFGLKGLEIGNL
jgi:hypothetical protein